ncbi:MAG: ABC transporter permease [Actinomycetota bacterium]|nr:ABC transporter permease [Actinomycetota bacterium]
MVDKRNSNTSGSLVVKFASIREISILGFLIVFSLVISLINPVFISLDNLYDIALDTAILAIVAVGQMMVILTRGIDISVGAGIGLSGMIVALIIKDTANFNPLLAILIGMIIGAAMGALNGVLIVKGNIPPIIATLGTMNIFRGLTFIINYQINGGQWVGADKLPEAFKNFARGTFLKIPNLILITIIVYLIFYYFLNHTTTGREIYATGSSPESAKIIGINVKKTIFLTYVITGILVGMAGVLWVARYTSAQTDSASGFEFTTITAVILGGVAVAGGSGSIWGVLFGAILIGAINSSLNLIGVSPFWKLAINGGIILVAVIIDAVLARNINKALKERKQI